MGKVKKEEISGMKTHKGLVEGCVIECPVCAVFVPYNPTDSAEICP